MLGVNMNGIEWNKILKMKVMQNVLDEAILKEHQCEFDKNKCKLALFDELGEMNHENKASWCWWKYTQKPVDREKLLEELVDAWHFALSLDNHTKKRIARDFDPVMYEHFEHLACNSLADLMAMTVYMDFDYVELMLLITEKLGFTIDDIYECYQKKNKVNFERLKNGY